MEIGAVSPGAARLAPHRGWSVRRIAALVGAGGASRRPAEIIGSGRSWTAWMISVLSIPRRYRDVIARSAWPSWRWITISET